MNLLARQIGKEKQRVSHFIRHQYILCQGKVAELQLHIPDPVDFTKQLKRPRKPDVEICRKKSSKKSKYVDPPKALPEVSRTGAMDSPKWGGACVLDGKKLH